MKLFKTSLPLGTYLDEQWHGGLGWLGDDEKPHSLVLNQRGSPWQITMGSAGCHDDERNDMWTLKDSKNDKRKMIFLSLSGFLESNNNNTIGRIIQ